FHGEIPQALDLCFPVTPLGPEQAINQVIADSEREGLKKLAGHKTAAGASERVMNVPQDGLTQRFRIKPCSGQQISGHSGSLDARASGSRRYAATHLVLRSER